MRVLYPPAYNVSFLGVNPIYREQYWSASGVAPHAETARIQYNIMAGKRAIITNVLLWCNRQTVATTSGEFALICMLNYGAGQHSIARIVATNNTTGVYYQVNLPSQIYVPQGTVLFVDTYDLSIGGTIQYIATVNFVEVDP